MTESAWMYERMSDPLLAAELRHLRGELARLTARSESAMNELDKRLTARQVREQTGGDAA